jgi:tetratricopeptide (TPR) repeat protein
VAQPRFRDPLVELIYACVGEAVSSGDSGAFLDWMRSEAPARFPAVFARFSPSAASRTAFWLGVAIWNVTPLPSNGFAPLPLRLPRQQRRNQVCVCGSGLALGLCCGDSPPLPRIPADLAWEAALACLPLERVREAAAAGELSAPRLGVLARRLLESGQAREAIVLLEPLFERPEQADESFAEALEMLFAGYLVLGRRRQRERLVERLTLELRPPLRARAWARRATMLADQGRHDEAWLAWERAHHDDPDDEALMQLEVTLLLVRGRLEQAAGRARFHLMRIDRAAQKGARVGPEVLALLGEAVADPAAAARRINGGRRPRQAPRSRVARQSQAAIGAAQVSPRAAAGPRRTARSGAAAAAVPGQYPLLQVKVTLAATRPPIWRRLRVSGAMTLADFHGVLQIALGWTNSHLHLFAAGDRLYGDPSMDLETALIDERRTPVGVLLNRPGDHIRYEYDFGDSWVHLIQVEKLAPATSGAPAAVCLGGRRRGPPEDCGGASGYQELLAILKGGDSAERRDLLNWLGGEIDPAAFDPAAISRQLVLV